MKRPSMDPITLEIVRNGLTYAAVEMNRTLVRTAYNPLLYEVQDFGLGIVSADGDLWAEAPGVTVFLGSLAETVRSGLRHHGLGGFEDGDVLIANDPYETGTHLSDTSVYVPAIFEGSLVAFAIATAHWADIGGKTPGGWCPDSTDIYQEGLCFSHEKLVAAGEPNAGLWKLIEGNVRFPDIVRGDLDAQLAACRHGVARIKGMCGRYGVERVQQLMRHAIDRADAGTRRRIEALPDGTYRSSIRMDGDGVTEGARPEVDLQLAVRGDTIRVGFEGTSPVAAGPVNLPAPGTRSSVRAALKGLLAPLDATNEGHFRALEFELPRGLVVSPERPAPCDSFGYIGTALIGLTMRAIAEAAPDRMPAGTFQLFGVYLFRVDERDGKPFILIDPADGGHGGRPAADGPSLIFLSDGDTPNTPVEVTEARYPVRCERYCLLPGTEGEGAHRGGMGLARDFTMLEDSIYLQTAIENTRDPLAKGLRGGGNGAPSAVVAWPGDRKEAVLQTRVSYFGPFTAGETVSVRSGGGGGWGDPLDRAPEQVLEDTRNGLIDPDRALATYGVVLARSDAPNPDWAVDVDRTLAERQARRPAAGTVDRAPTVQTADHMTEEKVR